LDRSNVAEEVAVTVVVSDGDFLPVGGSICICHVIEEMACNATHGRNEDKGQEISGPLSVGPQ